MMVSISRLAFVVALLGGLPACGGKLDPSSPSEPEVDGGVLDAVVPPGVCGAGACRAGTRCSPDGCNTCACGEGGAWACTDMACIDAGPPDPPPSTGCPPSAPSGPCKDEGRTCVYPNDCGGKLVTQCLKGAWARTGDPCGPPGCPVSLPKPGTKCPPGAKCAYPNACGETDVAYCDPTTVSWSVTAGTCAPPPASACPTTRPAPGASCATGASCQWDSGCGTIVYGYCGAGAWMFKDPGCSPNCPATRPTSGAACTTPGKASCSYMVPGSTSCTSSCFCADDGRWACVTPPCASTPGG